MKASRTIFSIGQPFKNFHFFPGIATLFSQLAYLSLSFFISKTELLSKVVLRIKWKIFQSTVQTTKHFSNLKLMVLWGMFGIFGFSAYKSPFYLGGVPRQVGSRPHTSQWKPEKGKYPPAPGRESRPKQRLLPRPWGQGHRVRDRMQQLRRPRGQSLHGTAVGGRVLNRGSLWPGLGCASSCLAPLQPGSPAFSRILSALKYVWRPFLFARFKKSC